MERSAAEFLTAESDWRKRDAENLVEQLAAYGVSVHGYEIKGDVIEMDITIPRPCHRIHIVVPAEGGN